MSKPAIIIEGLSKAYRIGHQFERYPTFREAIVRTLTGPLRRFRQLRAGGFGGGDREETFWALKDVSFEVQPGEVVGIIGRNGAGKSTLLKILSRITEPTEGRAILHGRVASLLEVGTGFHPELTGRENIYLNGAILGMKKAEIDRKFDEIVAFAEIEKFLDTPVKRYSSGMYVRLAFAVAAHLEPEILIVDEVLAVGDAAFQKKCLGKMQEVSRGDGRTVLFVSHNMAAISQLCRRCAWLEGGCIRRIGGSGDVVAAYLASEGEQVSHRRWSYPGNAPGDDRVRLLGCSVRQGGRPCGVIDINDSCEVELEFLLLRHAHNLITGVSAYSAEGVCLFACCDWRPQDLVPGQYRKQMRLPAFLFAEGRVNLLVQAVFYDPNIPSVVVPSALSLDAVDSDHPMAVRGGYKGAWPGVLRMRFEWDEAVPVG